MRGVVGAGPNDDGSAVSRQLDAGADEGASFRVPQRRGFAGRRTDDQRVDPGVQLPRDESAKRVEIDGSSAERGDERRTAADENRLFRVVPTFPKTDMA